MKIKKIDRFSLIKDRGDFRVTERTPAPAATHDDGRDRKKSDNYINDPSYKGGYNDFYTNISVPTKEMGDVIVNALNSKYGKVSYIDKNDINEAIYKNRIKLKNLIQ